MSSSSVRERITICRISPGRRLTLGKVLKGFSGVHCRSQPLNDISTEATFFLQIFQVNLRKNWQWVVVAIANLIGIIELICSLINKKCYALARYIFQFTQYKRSSQKNSAIQFVTMVPFMWTRFQHSHDLVFIFCRSKNLFEYMLIYLQNQVCARWIFAVNEWHVTKKSQSIQLNCCW